MNARAFQILLVEDNPGDARLTEEAFKAASSSNCINHVSDGELAMEFLRRQGRFTQAPRPDLILLDWNLPRKCGREVLTEIKADEELRGIPVIVLTTSSYENDILAAYNLNANCFITKPVDFDQYVSMLRSFEEFWLHVVRLPGE